jgi:hypothetical protein
VEPAIINKFPAETALLVKKHRLSEQLASAILRRLNDVENLMEVPDRDKAKTIELYKRINSMLNEAF